MFGQQIKLLCYMYHLLEALVFVTKVSQLHRYLSEILCPPKSCYTNIEHKTLYTENS
jgi:hypothetical protein